MHLTRYALCHVHKSCCCECARCSALLLPLPGGVRDGSLRFLTLMSPASAGALPTSADGYTAQTISKHGKGAKSSLLKPQRGGIALWSACNDHPASAAVGSLEARQAERRPLRQRESCGDRTGGRC